MNRLGRSLFHAALAAGTLSLSFAAAAVVVTLPKYNVSVNEVSVSGLSSGG